MKFTISVAILILKLSISQFLMVMFLALHSIKFIFFNSSALLSSTTSSHVADFNTRNLFHKFPNKDL